MGTSNIESEQATANSLKDSYVFLILMVLGIIDQIFTNILQSSN